MQNFDFYSPTFFAFGKDREQDAGALVKRFGGTKVLLDAGDVKWSAFAVGVIVAVVLLVYTVLNRAKKARMGYKQASAISQFGKIIVDALYIVVEIIQKLFHGFHAVAEIIYNFKQRIKELALGGIAGKIHALHQSLQVTDLLSESFH